MVNQLIPGYYRRDDQWFDKEGNRVHISVNALHAEFGVISQVRWSQHLYRRYRKKHHIPAAVSYRLPEEAIFGLMIVEAARPLAIESPTAAMTLFELAIQHYRECKQPIGTCEEYDIEISPDCFLSICLYPSQELMSALYRNRAFIRINAK